ncbi:MAG: hypothetical protein ACT4RN_17535 [Pseudonocardia sp.]
MAADEHTADAAGRLLCDRVHSAIARELHRHHDGDALVRYVAVAEVITVDGERALHSLSSPDMMVWESLGLLDYARELDRVAIVAREITGGG